MKKQLFVVLFFATISSAQASTIDAVLETYKALGTHDFSAVDGEAMWKKDYPDPKKPGKVRNCSTCHGEDLAKKGKHAKTGKIIDPLAPSVNNDCFNDQKFIAKWFKRNCKWVIGRECTPQEKGDFLMYLRNK